MGTERDEVRGNRSRRELLAGATGAVGVIAAQALLGARTVRASNGDPMFVATSMGETGTTTILNSSTASGVVAFYASSTGSGGTGIQGVSNTGAGIYGYSASGPGVLGGATNSSGDGVEGRAGDAGHSGVYGHNDSSNAGGKGVFGVSANGDGVVGNASSNISSGVFGNNDSGSAGGKGVFGSASNGVGVAGSGGQGGVLGTTSGSGSAVQGTNSGHGPSVRGGAAGTVGDGVEGRTDSQFNSGVFAHNESTSAGGKAVFAVSNKGIGLEASGGQIGVHAISSPTETGVGLRVDGRVVFRTAGTTVVPSGANHLSIALSGVTPKDFVLATVQQSGVFYVKNAVAGSGQFIVYLNQAPTSPTTVKVAWFVISAS